ncbi:dehydrogenase E1 component subunit alpha/beta [Methylomonas koyamae]|uniref:2-oxoglutarate dehydrogenase n=1 Tax=Methylomonas koyamae TaxID=702114 RepID=A0A291IP89_9GAMM|nr:alpha-ketoacid dehydrogenase subunit alpha/beta [Methylomonas koyamae]ATG92011.1 2-oxoglutarate dehydrogenase [Methylomonas koyamae]OAI25459.1 2-oxoglutarate dehydrogenase [Methylomonas koyamae]
MEISQQSTDQAILAWARDDHGKPQIALDPESLYRYGHLIRLTEQLVLDQFSRGLVSGTTHTCIGQELTAMSVVRALNHPDDAVLSNHRNHGHFLTYSGDFVGLVAEIMGREAGACGGWGGSQHLVHRHFHSNGVQGGMLGIGAGLALARKLHNSDGIVAAIIGDGTLGQGLVYEAMNLASVWNAPLLVVVENNGIAQTTVSSHTVGGDIEARGAAFGLPTWRLADDDPEFLAKVDGVVNTVRGRRGPGFLVIDTRRMGPHSKGDDLRDPEELEQIRNRDPLAALGRFLPADVRNAIESNNRQFVEAVRQAADASPEACLRETPAHIFEQPAQPEPMSVPEIPAGSNVRQAINSTLRHLLDSDKRVLVIGEDLHDPYGGAFKVTQGLSTDFPGRVISTPISEAGITGAAIGLALDGYLPIVEIMFADFLTLCMDQLLNHAVKFPGMFPDVSVPLVIRTPCGGRRGYGPTHSQSPEHLFTAVPGLTVAYPSHRHDVSGLLANAVQRWHYPVLFLEHKLLYGEKLDPADYTALDSADDVATELFPTLRRGADDPDVTLVAYGGMLPIAEAVVRRLETEEELAVEIVAPALLSPLPRDSMIGHLLERQTVVVVEESHHDFGVSAEIAAALLESGFSGQLLRIGTPPVPIASARSLERSIIPDEQSIIDQILDLF